MAIDVEWQDEGGACLLHYHGPELDSHLFDRAPIHSTCLRFIDPYGDTTFNRKQVEALEQELMTLADDPADELVARQARALLRFIGRVGDRSHTYLKFIGD